MKTFYKILFLLTWIVVLSGCTHRNPSSGRAIVVGKLTISSLNEQNKPPATVEFLVRNVLTGEEEEYKATLESDGTFSMEIPIISPTYVRVWVGSKTYEGFVLLSPGEITRMDLNLDETGKLKLNMIDGIDLKPEDFENIKRGVIYELMMAFAEGRNAPNIKYTITPNRYADSMLIRTEKDLAIIYEDTVLSDNHKKLFYDFYKQYYLSTLFFDYEDYVYRRYLDQQDEKEVKEKIFVPQNPDKSYYTFLRHFNLNDLPQMNDKYYTENLQFLLLQPELNIPRIGDTPIPEWQKEAKAILADLTGINSGLFYDILAAQAYIIQLRGEQIMLDCQPITSHFRNRVNTFHLDLEIDSLSEKQKENILSYYSNPSYADILFAENEKTILRLKAIEQNEQTHWVVNETPQVAKEKLLEAIVSKHKGKVVVVDFWATWCGPCMEAMRKSKSLKEEFSNKNVAFVYITNISSPVKLWEKKIAEIGNEHYYLNEEEWKSISYSDKYGFEGIPAYMIFDKNGIVKHKITGYPGNEKMQKMIEELL